MLLWKYLLIWIKCRIKYELYKCNHAMAVSRFFAVIYTRWVLRLDELNYSWSPSGAIIETLSRLITENAQASWWFITLAIHLSRIDTHARAIRRATRRHAMLFLFRRQCFRRINASDYVTGAITTPWYVRTVIIFWSSSLWLSSSTVGGVGYHRLLRAIAFLLSFLQRYCERINGKLIFNEKSKTFLLYLKF